MSKKNVLKFTLPSLFLLFLSCLQSQPQSSTTASPSEIKTQLSEGAKNLLKQALLNIDSTTFTDYHTHLAGVGSGNTGNYVNEKMLSKSHLISYLKFKIYMEASGIKDLANADSEFLNRLTDLINNIPAHGKHYILAFDAYYDTNGVLNKSKTEFYVNNEYVFKVAQTYPNLFNPVMSVHPYRKDALAELEKWAGKGGKMVKWLPNAMGIDPSDKRCIAYYQKMKALNLVLLSHAGEEKAVESEDDQKYGNPLLLRAPLNAGIKVIIAHCASLGENKDLDNGGKQELNFNLFMRLMNEKKYEGLLFGDISAMTQYNRCGEPLQTVLKRKDLHHRLVNGSDFPLPAINIIIRTKPLVNYGYITQQEANYLKEIYQYNPLLFDFVVKRTLKIPGTNEHLPASLFMRNPELGI